MESISKIGGGGSFMEHFILQPNHAPNLPLNSLTFSIKDMYDVKGRVSSFGNPDWAKTHLAATCTAPTILNLLEAGATCVGKNIMDEMAYSIMGENIHYGTPKNVTAPDRVPGGSSSGSAVAVASELVDFSMGTDCIGSSRVPASYCGVFGIRPSHSLVSSSGVIPMAQSLDTVGWFARDPKILNKVGSVLLKFPEIHHVKPAQIIIADDCFELSSIPYKALTSLIIKAVEKLYGGGVLKHQNIGSYVNDAVPSLESFSMYNIPPIVALSSAMQYLERYEFKKNHGEWVTAVNPKLGPGISDSVYEALRISGKQIDTCYSVFKESRDAITNLLGDSSVIMMPTVSGPPPKLKTNISELKNFLSRAFSLQSIAGTSGCCQVSIPIGKYNDVPISISLLASHGADGFLLSLVDKLYEVMQGEEVVN
ncbi:amidase 1-like [Vicia villosa]|uniref:amidase 1-like n=1 Tax=Vicia villosa TaxID=3911 RepID=UPI00273C1FF4|nr:amidase 1-like [Vicia villosa]